MLRAFFSFSIFIILCVISTQDPLVQLGFVSFALNVAWQTVEDKCSHIEVKQNRSYSFINRCRTFYTCSSGTKEKHYFFFSCPCLFIKYLSYDPNSALLSVFAFLLSFPIITFISSSILFSVSRIETMWKFPLFPLLFSLMNEVNDWEWEWDSASCYKTLQHVPVLPYFHQ